MRKFIYTIFFFYFISLGFSENINILDYFPTEIGRSWIYANEKNEITNIVSVIDIIDINSSYSKGYLFQDTFLINNKKFNSGIVYICDKDNVSLFATLNAFGVLDYKQNPFPIVLTCPNKEWKETADTEDEHNIKTVKTSCRFDKIIYDDCILVEDTQYYKGEFIGIKKSYYAKGVGLVYITLTDKNGKESVFQKLIQ